MIFVKLKVLTNMWDPRANKTLWFTLIFFTEISLRHEMSAESGLGMFGLYQWRSGLGHD